jgi:hypothetical protein
MHIRFLANAMQHLHDLAAVHARNQIQKIGCCPVLTSVSFGLGLPQRSLPYASGASTLWEHFLTVNSMVFWA